MNTELFQFDFGPLLVAASVFGAVTFGLWGIMFAIMSRKQHWTERVKKLNFGDTADSKGRLEKFVNKTTSVKELLEKAAPTLSKPLMPKSELEQSKLRLRLAAAGWRGEKAVPIYLASKVICIFIGVLIGFAVAGFSESLESRSWTVVVVCGGLGFYLPDVVVYLRRKYRHDAIFCALPDALDLMVVCVEAGLTLDAAMRRVSREMKRRAPVLANEFELCNMQLQMGRPRREVLHELGVRNDVEDLRSLAAILIQADRFGSSIANALRVQSDSMRTRRRQLAEEKAQKTAVKLLIPLILFIFPGIFVVLVGPAGIMIARNLGSAM